MGKVIPLFGDKIHEHLKKTKTNEQYIKLRLERFREEFLRNDDVYTDDLHYMLESIAEYMEKFDEHEYLTQSIYNLQQSIWWLELFENEIDEQ